MSKTKSLADLGGSAVNNDSNVTGNAPINNWPDEL